MHTNQPLNRRCTSLALAALLAAGLANGADKTKPDPKYDLPPRDLTVELRQVEEGLASGYTVSTAQTAAQASGWPAQGVRVRNGEKATMRVAQSMPVQWVQSVAANSQTLSTPGTNLKNAGGSVQQSLHWMNTGQSLVLTPRWRGGIEDATVEVELQTSSVGGNSPSGVPRQTQSELATTVTAPLGYWVVIATSGGQAAPQGSYSSAPANEVRRTVQVRVTAP